jgi:membrane-associated phospholipid phosphatase
LNRARAKKSTLGGSSEQPGTTGHTILDDPTTRRKTMRPRVFSVILFVAGIASLTWAQQSAQDKNIGTSTPEQSVDTSPPPINLKSLPRNLFIDQKNFWLAPFHMNERDWQWTVPAGFVGATLLASDTAIEKHAPTNPSTVSHANTASNAGLAAMAAVGGGMFLWGHATHDDQKRETGILSGEAGLDAFLDTEVFAYTFGRQRPFTGNGKGKFFQGGTSFPSQHAAISWAIASVIAHEYPGPLTQLFAYGLASGVSAARFVAQQHFASDLVVGAALGWYLGRQVYHSHSHYSDADIARWGTFKKSADEDTAHDAGNMGSPYVPLDSWIYPALDRLTALGFIHTGFADMRPWTRLECARQIKEAADGIADESAESEASRLYESLHKEFELEMDLLDGGTNEEIGVESAYSRSTEIAGKPLTDGDHFGQTIINDYGRPEERGFNDVSGMSAWGAYGPLAFYVQGEYQHSPSAPALPLGARMAISRADFSQIGGISPNFPLPPDTPISEFNEARFLDTYVAMNFSNWQFSYGNQSLWWGPSQGGPLMFSDNAQPLRMFRVNRVVPFKLPSFLGLLGPMRLEAFIGQYSGYQFVYAPPPLGIVGQYGTSVNPQPIDHGERISFKPTSNLEVGISRTTDYGGPGYPLTLHTFLRSVFSTGNTLAGNPNKPGSRRSGLDFSYRVPGVRNGMTFYAEGMAEHNEISPLIGPDVAAWLAGIYIPRLPRIPKLDLRLEGGYTDPPYSGTDVAHGAFYWDATWITGFQNAGHLMGSWMGRQGQGAQAWTTYWFSPRNKLQFGYRHQKVSQQFIEDGGNLADINIRGEFCPRAKVTITSEVQYERWLFPVIQSNASRNVTASVGINFEPHRMFRRGSSDTNRP